MTLVDVNLYIGLKATLLSQINSDDTVSNIESTLVDISNKKADILSMLTASIILDDASGVSTVDKINFINVVTFCKYGDSNLFEILISWFNRIDLQLTQTSDPTVIAALNLKIASIKADLKIIVPSTRQDLLKIFIQDP